MHEYCTFSAWPATIWMVMLLPIEATCWKKMTAQYPDFPAREKKWSQASNACEVVQYSHAAYHCLHASPARARCEEQ